MNIEINLNEHLDNEDVQKLAEEWGVGVPEMFEEIDFKKLSMVDNDKIKLFVDKFQSIPLSELETFLNKY